ncbi:MAG: hypothetical protein HW412_1093 [Bacteroidetes bacterium]|nr:hypothetical protein [Bacteroidota bacterium]
MRNIVRSFALTALFVLPSEVRLVADGLASDSIAGHLVSNITIQSIPESAYVMLDGKLVGSATITIDSINPGLHVLTLQHRNVESWLTEPVSDTVRLEDGETKVLRYNLDRRYFVTSSPFGAEVVVDDSVIGTTPITMTSAFVRRPITLRKQGYEPASINLSDDPFVSASLNKLWQNDGNMDSYFRESSHAGSKPIGLYISGAATVLSGVAAAYFKVKADDKYQQFLQTRDTNLRSQTNRLDTAAGIAIAATQIWLGLFTYFILSQ